MILMRLLRCAAVLSLAVLSAPSAWAGGYPLPSTSIVPSMLRLVGSANGAPDAAAGQFTVTVRNLAQLPISGCSIVVDLSGCPDLVLCSDQMDPDAFVNCAAKSVRKLTDAQGTVTFTLLGGSTGAGHAESLAQAARVFGNGSLIGIPSVSTFDLDGVGGIGAGDLSAWLSDFGSGVAWERSDFDGSGDLSAGDLSMWLAAFGAGTSTRSCGSSCP